jgi:putative copper resistance protein D
MELLVDLFGFLSVLLRGAAFVARSMTLGGVAALWLMVPPDHPELVQRCRRWLGWSAGALVVILLVAVLMQGLVLAGTVDLPASEAFSAGFAQAGFGGAGVAVAVMLLAWRFAAPRGPLIICGLLLLLCAVASSHGASRLEHRLPLMLSSALHQLGAGVWIGGMPYFLLALASGRGGDVRQIGRRFSLMSMGSVAAILTAGLYMAVQYIDSIEALYGTAYGVMVSAKTVLTAGLLCLGAANFRLVERLRADPTTPILRLKRFAEVELGVGITVLFAAASLTSVPPAVDLTRDRVSLAEYVERLTPNLPRLVSPDHDKLAIPALQAKLDAEAAARSVAKAPTAFVPGAGKLPPRNAQDVAWSEYNHHVSGILVSSIGLLALLARSGRATWARHWPLLFLLLAGFLLFRSDPEAWPIGSIGFWDSLRDPEIVQHRVFAALLVGFTIFEWRVRTGRTASRAQALVFPLLCAFGGGLLLTHSHALANVKEQLIIEVTHFPLSLLGVAAGWARWLELRYEGQGARIAGWVWPLCLLGVGAVLLSYREA